MKHTLVIGASENPDRYANKAVRSLLQHGKAVIAYGNEAGNINGVPVEAVWNPEWQVDTVTLYINPLVQEKYYQKIIDLKPRRVIFNPGTENEEFMEQLKANGIFPEVACTLVLLSINQFD